MSHLRQGERSNPDHPSITSDANSGLHTGSWGRIESQEKKFCRMGSAQHIYLLTPICLCVVQRSDRRLKKRIKNGQAGHGNPQSFSPHHPIVSGPLFKKACVILHATLYQKSRRCNISLFSHFLFNAAAKSASPDWGVASNRASEPATPPRGAGTRPRPGPVADPDPEHSPGD